MEKRFTQSVGSLKALKTAADSERCCGPEESLIFLMV